MKGYWVITERGSNVDSFTSNGFTATNDFMEETSDKAHISFSSKEVYTYYDWEGVDNYDIYIKDFDINKYNELCLLVSLGIPIEEALKEI